MKLLLLNIHGLIRASQWEIGRDSDNGGQIVYVMEMAKRLSLQPEVSKVVVLTRRIDDSDLDDRYNQEFESVSDRLEIRRVSCGPKRYLLKEELWPHLDDFVTNAVKMFKKEGLSFDFLYGHYADAGYVATQLSMYLNKPFAFAGHSLGRPKLQNLIAGGMPAEEVEKRYSISERIEAEEIALSNAEFVVTSTRFEIGFWESYRNHGMAEYTIIPPGFNMERFYPYMDIALDLPHVGIEDKMAVHNIREKVERFLAQPSKPMILVVCRPTQTKNLEGVLHLYGTSKELQALANLVIFPGIREDIETMPASEKEVLTKILLLMDKYNLYGKIAIPKKHDAARDIPAAYRYCAQMKGVFLNAALMENFGLTALEASACGCPVVVTNAGGPAEIVANCQNGFACDPLDPESFVYSLRSLLVDDELWRTCSENGIKNVRERYTWDQHCTSLLHRIQVNLKSSTGAGVKSIGRRRPIFDRLAKAKRMFVTDIDGTLVSPESNLEGLETLKSILAQRGENTAFVLATGRNLPLVLDVLNAHQIPEPDIVIASVGSQVFYGAHGANSDLGWEEYIAHRFDRADIQERLLKLPYLRLQEDKDQNAFKISFICESPESYRTGDVERVLGRMASHVNIIWSHGSFLDILPRRASKGRAMRYLAFKWNIQLGDSLAAGDSGNDMDLFMGSAKGIVVGNHAPEVEVLRTRRNVYFAKASGAAGILEGFIHFGFINRSHFKL